MPNSKQSHKSDVAPLKIVEFYEKFKDAMKNGDFARGRECLRYMRQYQGGEKLAKELEREFDAFTEEGVVFDDAISDEEQAQQVLSHLELCETFIADNRFEQAWLEMEWIQKQDESLAYSLEKKIEKARRKFQKEQHKNNNVDSELEEEKVLGESLKSFTSISEALKLSASQGRKLFEQYSKNLIEEDAQKIEKLLIKKEEKELQEKQQVLEDAFYIALHDEDAEALETLLKKMKQAEMKTSSYQKLALNIEEKFLENAKTEVLEALKEGRTTFAANLIKKYDFSTATKNELNTAVENKRQEKIEEKRLEKVQNLQSQLESFLKEKNFKKAEGCLTKIATFGTQKEELMFQEFYDQALEGDKKDLQKKLEQALEKNISEEDFTMAEKNLRDYKKIASIADFELQKAAIQNGKKRSEQKYKKVSVEGFESTKKVQNLFTHAQKALANQDYNAVAEIADQIAAFGDEEIAFSLRQALKKQKQVSQQVPSLQHQFEILLEQKNFKEAENFLKNNIESPFIQNLLEEKLLHSRVRSQVVGNIDKKNFDEARKCISTSDISASLKADLFLLLDREIQSQEQQKRENEIQKLEHEISVALQSRQYDRAHEFVQQFEQLNHIEKSLDWRKEIRQAEIQEQVQLIEEDVDILKQEGRFDDALELSRKMLELEQESAFEATRVQIKRDEALFARHKQEAFFAHVRELFYQGKINECEEQRQSLTVEQNLELDFLIQQQQEQQEQEAHNKKVEDAQKLFFTLPLHQKQSFVEEIQFFVDKQSLQNYFEHIEEEKEKEVQKLLMQVEAFFDVVDFKQVRSIAQKISELGAWEAAETLLVRCLHLESEHKKEILDAQRKDVFDDLEQLYTVAEFHQFFQLLLTEKELFIGDDAKVLREKITYWLEEQIVLHTENLDFVTAEYALQLLQSFDKDVATMLTEILYNKKQDRLQKMNLVGAREAVKKRTALLHYQAWKKDYLSGRFSPVYREHIHNLGEKSFAKVLEEIENRELGSIKIKNAFIKNTDLTILEKTLREQFYALDFMTLEDMCRHFSDVFHITTKERYKKNIKQFEKELFDILDAKDFTKAEALFDAEIIHNLELNDVLRMHDVLEQRKTIFAQEEQERVERKIYVAIEQKDWNGAKQLCATLPLPDYLKQLQLVLENQKSQLFNDLYAQWTLFKSDIASALHKQNFVRAWKEFEKAEGVIPFEIFREERGGLIQEMFQTFESFIHKEKLKIHEAVQQGDLKEARNLIQNLDVLQQEYNAHYKGAISQEENFQRSYKQIRDLLKLQKEEKVHSTLRATKDILSSRQFEYLEWFVKDFASQSAQQHNELCINKFKECIAVQDFLSAQKYLDDTLDAVQKSLMKQFLENTITKNQDQEFQEHFQSQLLENYHKASDILEAFSGTKKIWLECFITLQKHKKQQIWKRFDTIIQSIRSSLLSQNIVAEKLQEAESLFLENGICTGEFRKIEHLKEIFETIQLNQNLCDQKNFYSFLESQEWNMALSFIDSCLYKRLASYLQKQLQQERQKDRKALDNVKKSLAVKDFDDAKKQLRDLHAYLVLQDIDETYVVLLEQEAHIVEEKRKSTVVVMIEDVQMLLKQEKLEEAEELFIQISSLATQEEKQKIEDIIDAARQKHGKQKRIRAVVDTTNKQEAKKQYEKFVLEALNGYNPREARNFYQELQSLGGGSRDDELVKQIVQQEQELLLLEEIRFMQSFNQVLELEKKIVQYEQEDRKKGKVARKTFETKKENLIQELIKQKKFEEAEQIITTL